MVETTHPGNIGATARVMANMGLSQLCLVNPRSFPDPAATARAAGADYILDHWRGLCWTLGRWQPDWWLSNK